MFVNRTHSRLPRTLYKYYQMFLHAYLAICVLIIKCTCTCCNIGVHPLPTSSTHPWCKWILGEFWKGIAGTLKACNFSVVGLWPMESAVQCIVDFLHWTTGLSCASICGEYFYLYIKSLATIRSDEGKHTTVKLSHVLASLKSPSARLWVMWVWNSWIRTELKRTSSTS